MCQSGIQVAEQAGSATISGVPVAARARALKHEAMPEINAPYAQGTPCWIDLMAKDQQAAMDFYKDLFGWEGERQSDEFGGYAVMSLRGKAVAGIGPSMAPEGMPEPPHVWTTYLASDDADATAQRIAAAGGSVMVPVMDVGDLGRMAIAVDPTGAVFGFWQHKSFIGATLVNEDSTLTWNECNTRDVPAASAFYHGAFGVDTNPMEGAENYFILEVGGRPVGGMQDMSVDFPKEVPPHWMSWFEVDDVESTVDAAVKAGATLTVPPMEIPPGRMAGLADPWGAVFCVLKSEPMDG
jgi:predicted enzyme related to lactoylglutathione lyase